MANRFIPTSAPQATFLKSAPAGTEQIATGTAQQQANNQALGNRISGSLGNLSLPGQQNSQYSFAPIAQQAQRNFQTQTVPGLAERFTSLGGGQLGSPAFASALGQAGAGLQSDLAAQQQQFGMQQEGMQNQNLMQLLSHFAQPQFENLQHGSEASGISQAFQSLIQQLTQQQQGGGNGLQSILKLLMGV